MENFKKVFHAVLSDHMELINDSKQFFSCIEKLAFEIFNQAEESEVETIALPLIYSGILKSPFLNFKN